MTALANNAISEVPPQQLTKRMLLSQINSVYDPLGLAGPFTVRAKILMRHLWGSDRKLDWDDPIPEENKENWITFFKDLQDMNQIRFMRCMKPSDAIGEPVLIVFSDASQDAYAACAYVRWKRQNGQFESNLISSKNRLAPITFAATRIGEIQEGTSQSEWYWVESKHNIADCITRGKKPSDIGLESTWQKGPEFLKQPENEWPITRNYLEPQLPELVKTAMATNIEAFQDTLAGRIHISKYSNYNKLLRVTARIMKLYDRNPKPSIKNAANDLTPHDVEKAELFWIRELNRTWGRISRSENTNDYAQRCAKMVYM